jgi:hypothetical protein
MTGATILTAAALGVGQALFPACVGVLLVTVILGRRRWAGRATADLKASATSTPIVQVKQRAA